MKKKKSTSLFGLFYRELYPARKEFIFCYIIAIALSVVFHLIKLSMEVGNLANLSAANLETLKTLLPGYAIYLPACLFMTQALSSIGTFPFELSTKWRCFQASLPVSEWKLIGVKFLTSGLTLFVGIIASIINATIMCKVYDMTFTKNIIANLLFCTMGISLFCTLLYTLSYLFRNLNLAFVVMFVSLYVTAIIFVIKNTDYLDELSTKNGADAIRITLGKITDFSTTLLPFSIPCIISVLLLGWIFCSLLAKRREK